MKAAHPVVLITGAAGQLGTAVAALGTTAVLFFTRPTVTREAGTTVSGPRFHLSPTAGLSGGGLLLQGAF